MRLVHIVARDLPEAWFLCIKETIEKGRDYKITEGSYKGQTRKQLDFVTVHIKSPGTEPLIPDIPPGLGIPPPVTEDYIIEYLPYLITGEKQPGEDYTYGQRLNDPMAKVLFDGETKELPLGVNQIEEVIRKYREGGYGQNQCTMAIEMPSDIKLNDPPCLRMIDTKIIEGKLNFYPYFRSWDLWGGFPANLAGLQHLKAYMAAEIGVKDGEIIACSAGLHLYDHCWEIAYTRLGKYGELKK